MLELTLSSIFYKPNDELIDLLLDRGLDDIKEMLVNIGHVEKTMYLDTIKRKLSDKDYLGKLKSDYNLLFFGPGKLLAPPYSSIYIDGFGQVETTTTKRVKEIYMHWGVKLHDNIKEPVDHVAIELSFLHHLDNIYKESGNVDAMAQKEEFLEHMSKWVGKLSEQINAHQTLSFYGYMSEILIIYIDDQLKKIKK